MLGLRICGFNCNSPTCDDDTAVVTEERGPLQTLQNISDDYSGLKQYLLQLLKSVVLAIPHLGRETKLERGQRSGIDTIKHHT